jgi:hypothetical protein
MSLDPEPIDWAERHEERMRRMRAALDALTEMVEATSWNGNQLVVQRGGIRYGEHQFQFPQRDTRQGEEVYVYDILPGARVYVLEDVFTVDRVDMDGPLPTVWLKELPTSPLYFTEDESIYLANETED